MHEIGSRLGPRDSVPARDAGKEYGEIGALQHPPRHRGPARGDGPDGTLGQGLQGLPDPRIQGDARFHVFLKVEVVPLAQPFDRGALHAADQCHLTSDGHADEGSKVGLEERGFAVLGQRFVHGREDGLEAVEERAIDVEEKRAWHGPPLRARFLCPWSTEGR